MEEAVSPSQEVTTQGATRIPNEGRKRFLMPSQSYKISAGQFQSQTSLEERNILRTAVSQAICFFAGSARPVHLDGLGILSPTLHSRVNAKPLKNRIALQEETLRQLCFEKCDTLEGAQRLSYPQLVETKHLAGRIYPRLPLELQLKWTQKELERLIRGFFRFLRDEIVKRGFSAELSEIGDFFALHNRQGSSLADWFAGASIFLDSHYQEITEVSSPRLIPQARFADAWEPFQALYGKAVDVFKIDLAQELTQLGYDGERFKIEVPHNEHFVQVAVFRLKSEGTDSSTLLYVTNGLRQYGLKCRKADTNDSFGTELIFQVTEDETKIGAPRWPARPLTIGWLLLTSAKSKTLTPGCGFNVHDSLSAHSPSELTSIFCTEFSSMRSAQRSEEGRFFYTNIVGITADEAKILESHGARVLARLLEFKGYHQVTKLNRSTILHRSGFYSDERLKSNRSSEKTESMQYLQ